MSWITNLIANMKLSESDRIKVIWCLASAAYWVIFLWGFWQRGPLAFGLNAFVYLIFVGWLFVWTMRREGVSLRKNWWWLAPLVLIAASFFLYNNPFLKMISFMLLPVLTALFYNAAFTSGYKPIWGMELIGTVAFRVLKILGMIVPAVRLHRRLLNTSRQGQTVIKRILVGLLLLLVISFTVIVPLLSSADAEFASRVDFILEWFQNLISTIYASKVLMALLISLLTLATLLSWSIKFEVRTNDREKQSIDSIVAGIVLGGILAVYLLFLWLQVKNLWVGRLPFEFDAVVTTVKSGFWQLLALSIINILIYFFAYRRTVPVAQMILLAFSIASLLLLASAGYRLALYVINFGFSYEKFFASYTVLFCAVLFIWLICRLLASRRSDILKFLAVLFLWMFAVVAILPVEQFILRANLKLAQRDGSRIRIYELTMLSPDVLATVKRYWIEGKLNEVNPVYLDVDRAQFSEEELYEIDHPDWAPWIEQQTEEVAGKRWHERTLSDWLN